ncbi:DNA-binding transcriptional ArsR family regulator [Paenibacillus anaericanus]|uniref:ArsR/SmtB family transcription factor n=1 Tax=Paenibacillus anaericanus TaxID=170367 RepID=UPI002784E323|nr:metalloregulator ArsR/SmtB family transcription factor [Paenibacillus anaericanus]MDQ0087922.1 DNA-binding transcriptional ArsR family regulator [Paenibacillus anaericanus]
MTNTINIRISTPMEFMNSLFALGTDKGFIEMIRAFDLEPNDEITGMLQKMSKTLSHYIQQELTYFFDASGLGFIFYKYIIHNPTLNKVTDVVEKIQQDTADEFVFRIIESVCKNTLPAKGSQAYKALLGNKSGLLELLGVTKVQDEHRRVRVVEALENPEEIKQRFTLLLSRFYAVSFAPFEADIIQCIETEQPRYEVMLAETPELFIRQFMNLDDLKDHSAGYIIHLSFFKYVSCHAYSSYKEDIADWFVVGIYSYLLFSESVVSERQAQFFKVLSDVNRIGIIRLLSERPWFGQELAEALNISPPTVSYHISFLQQIGVVKFTRTDNRFYYFLDRSKLMKPLEDFMKSFE